MPFLRRLATLGLHGTGSPFLSACLSWAGGWGRSSSSGCPVSSPGSLGGGGGPPPPSPAGLAFWAEKGGVACRGQTAGVVFSQSQPPLPIHVWHSWVVSLSGSSSQLDSIGVPKQAGRQLTWGVPPSSACLGMATLPCPPGLSVCSHKKGKPPLPVSSCLGSRLPLRRVCLSLGMFRPALKSSALPAWKKMSGHVCLEAGEGRPPARLPGSCPPPWKWYSPREVYACTQCYI